MISSTPTPEGAPQPGGRGPRTLTSDRFFDDPTLKIESASTCDAMRRNDEWAGAIVGNTGAENLKKEDVRNPMGEGDRGPLPSVRI